VIVGTPSTAQSFCSTATVGVKPVFWSVSSTRAVIVALFAAMQPLTSRSPEGSVAPKRAPSPRGVRDHARLEEGPSDLGDSEDDEHERDDDQRHLDQCPAPSSAVQHASVGE
jgi:hypothetical protein